MRAHSYFATAFSTLALVALAGCSGSGTDPASKVSASATNTWTGDSGTTPPGKCHEDSCFAILPQIPHRPMQRANTVPPNGDVNPYGVAFVPVGFPTGGMLAEGDVIVANFNNSMNLQGTGTTVVRVNRQHPPDVFYSNPSAPGFSTALGVLSAGFVVLGNVPSTDGSGMCTGNMDNVGDGSLMFIDAMGKLVLTLTHPTLLAGPWDLTVVDQGNQAWVFVSDVKTGTVTRVNLSIGQNGPTLISKTQIASGYMHRCDPNAFVIGPTGLAYDAATQRLYVASTGDNAIFAIADAGTATTDQGMGQRVTQQTQHFHGPLGLVLAKNGDLISAQGDAVNPNPKRPSEIVEVTKTGKFVDQFSVDSAPGSAFGLALMDNGIDGFRFAAVDDGKNELDIWLVR